MEIRVFPTPTRRVQMGNLSDAFPLRSSVLNAGTKKPEGGGGETKTRGRLVNSVFSCTIMVTRTRNFLVPVVSHSRPVVA